MAGLEQYKTYDEKLQLLNTIIESGIEKLLKEAETKDLLEAPYGRIAEPTPLISESDWENELKSSLDNGMPIGQIPETAPDCEFTYGFDALQFFSQFIDWSHPINIEKRHQEKLTASKALHYRTQHARAQLATADSLRTTVEQQKSGILWGPFTTPLSHSSVLIVLKPLKLGNVTIQSSETKDFTGETVQTITAKVVSESSIRTDESRDEVKLEDILPIKEYIHDLKAGCRHYIRCFLHDSPAAPLFEGSKGANYQSSHFTTLPSEDEDHTTHTLAAASSDTQGGEMGTFEDGHLPVSLMCFGSMSQGKDTSTSSNKSEVLHSGNANETEEDNENKKEKETEREKMNDKERENESENEKKDENESESGKTPTVSSGEIGEITVPSPNVHCLLGDILASNVKSIDTSRELTDKQQLSERISDLFSFNSLFNKPESMLRSSSLLIGWRDSTPAGAQSIRKEESTCKQFQRELKKYQKKYNIGSGKKTKKGSSGAAAPPSPPVLSRPTLPAAFQAMVHSFPSEFNASAMDIAATADPMTLKTSSMLYRSVMLGPEVQVFLLDVRDSGSAIANECAFLGKQQAAWLYAALDDSQALWKVLLCGKSFGLLTLVSEIASTSMDAAVAGLGSPVGKSLNQQESPRDRLDEVLLASELKPSDNDRTSTNGQQAQGEDECKSGDGNGLHGDGAGRGSGEVSPVDKTLSREADLEPRPTTEEGATVQKKGVSMMVPEKNPHQDEEEDLDDMGRSKYSLQYVLSTLQNSKYRPVDSAGSRSDVGFTSLSTAGESAASSDEPTMETETYSRPQTAEGGRGGASDGLPLESGIVLLTSANIAVPAVPGAASAMMTKPSPAVPSFICTYSDLHSSISDGGSVSVGGNQSPSQQSLTPINPIFCAEVSMGSGGTAAAAEAAVESPIAHKFLEGLDAAVVYCSNPGTDCASGGDAEALVKYSAAAVPTCQLSLLPDGDLQVQLMYVPPGQEEVQDNNGKGTIKGAVAYRCKFQTQHHQSQSTDDQD